MNDSLDRVRIWQPSVELTGTPLPEPGPSSLDTCRDGSQLYTRTSLASNNNQSYYATLNRDIRAVSQSFNNSPKPFKRQDTTLVEHIDSTVTTTTTPMATRSYSYEARASSVANTRNQEQHTQQGPQQMLACRNRSNQSMEPTARPSVAQNRLSANMSHLQQQHHGSTTNMANNPATPTGRDTAGSKLVHKQYNSPLDLYSMNNIRKTIEAHTELIAPGVKGINFMKPDTPVNKQSEVYKLVMEQEQHEHREHSTRPMMGSVNTAPGPSQQASTQRLVSPAGLMANTTSSSAASYAAYGGQQLAASRHEVFTPAQPSHGHPAGTAQQGETNVSSTSGDYIVAAGQPPASHQEPPQQLQEQQQPRCFECGRSILGPFARIQDRFVHPHCFNCTTCGASLKNSGFFTVNDKLYCEIHAKQVANMMHIRYDFDSKSNASALCATSTTNTDGARRIVSQSDGASDSHRSRNAGSPWLVQQDHSPSSATISTMFSKRTGQQESSNVDSSRWSWRPMSAKERTASSNQHLNIASKQASAIETRCNSCTKAVESSSSTLHLVQTSSSLASREQQQQQHYATPSSLTGETTRTIAPRLPVCKHCQVHIHGPYIMAGKHTWCKPCSQTNFNCYSCKRCLLDTGFIEDSSNRLYCEHCFETYHTPMCSKCKLRIKGDCLNALGEKWHPSCFVCGHCRRPFGNSSFYLEDSVPYCERDWNLLFTTKCFDCSGPIEAGDKWIEALGRSYHSNCFRCTACQANLEGSTFYCKGNRPYCRLHAR